MSIVKRVKKWLKRHKRLLALGGIFLALTAIIVWDNLLTQLETPAPEQIEESINTMGTGPIEVILETKYLCGVETEIKTFAHFQAVEAWLEEYKEEWSFQERENGVYKLVRSKEQELSPLCKNEGYFGLTEDDILSVFQGPPADNQVIESFFRIDTQILDVRLPKEEVEHLYKGIRVQTVAEYLSILSTFGEYALDD